MITSLTSADRTALGRGTLPAGRQLHFRRASLRLCVFNAIRIPEPGGSRWRSGACDPKKHSSIAATVLGRLRPGPTSPSWLLLSARSVWLFWAGCVPPSGVLGLRRRAASLSGARGSKLAGFYRKCLQALARGGGHVGARLTSSSPRSPALAQIEAVYKLRQEELELLATVSRRASLACQPQLRTKRVDLFDSGVRALARGGGYAGDCFASCLLVRQPRPRTKRVGFRHYRARASAQRGYEAGDRLASSSTSLVILSSERSTWASIAIVWHKEGACRRLFRVELTSLVILGSVRSTWASVITVRELRHGDVETLATVSRRALRACQLQQQAQLRSKHVGFYNLRMRALARGGECAGDRFASSSIRESTSAQDEARWLPVLCTSPGTRVWFCWRLISIEPYLPRTTQLGTKRVGFFRYCGRGLAQGRGMRRLLRVELTSLVILGSVRSTWASVITVRELRHGEVETLATVSRRAPLACQPQHEARGLL